MESLQVSAPTHVSSPSASSEGRLLSLGIYSCFAVGLLMVTVFEFPLFSREISFPAAVFHLILFIFPWYNMVRLQLSDPGIIPSIAETRP